MFTPYSLLLLIAVLGPGIAFWQIHKMRKEWLEFQQEKKEAGAEWEGRFKKYVRKIGILFFIVGTICGFDATFGDYMRGQEKDGTSLFVIVALPLSAIASLLLGAFVGSAGSFAAATWVKKSPVWGVLVASPFLIVLYYLFYFQIHKFLAS